MTEAVGSIRAEVETVGRLVRARRRYIGWTQDALAARMHVSREAVSRLERGARRADLALLARALAAMGQALRIEIIDKGAA